MRIVEPTAQRSVDVALGASALVLEKAAAARRWAGPVMGPVGRAVLHPPLLPSRLQPGEWLTSLGERGADVRASLARELSRLLDVLVPAVLAEVLRRLDLTETVIRHVDLDAVVAAVDLDAAASRIDVDAVVRRVDLDSAVSQVDLDKVVGWVDLDAVAQRLDVDAVVRRVDLDAILDRLDLTGVVLSRVDLEAIVSAVLDRIDLAGLAAEVIDEIDLPEIIRESSGSMASDTVRSARMQGIAADEAVGRAVDRLLLRRAPRG
jgi:hypothetical protein